MMLYRLLYIGIIFVCSSYFKSLTWAQQPQTQPTKVHLMDSSQIEVDIMDTIVFNPQANIKSVEDLIVYLQNDTTFHKAFKNLHFNNYNADHKVIVYDKKGKTQAASLHAETKNIYRNRCRWMNILEESIAGDYYNKKGKPNYYTCELYQSMFYEKDTICNENQNLSKNYLNPSGNAMEKNKAQLKLLMFNPGAKIKGIPFIGNKASIFDPEVAQNYHFKLYTEEKNGILCYVFEAKPKPELASKVIYQNFTTWFDPNDMHIVARDYHLKFDHSLYDFDVVIKVNLAQKGGNLLVQTMYFNGNWRVISQGRERVSFNSIFYH